MAKTVNFMMVVNKRKYHLNNDITYRLMLLPFDATSFAVAMLVL